MTRPVDNHGLAGSLVLLSRSAAYRAPFIVGGVPLRGADTERRNERAGGIAEVELNPIGFSGENRRTGILAGIETKIIPSTEAIIIVIAALAITRAGMSPAERDDNNNNNNKQ